MQTNLRELITAVISSRKFTKFFDGAPFILPDGKTVTVKVTSHEKGVREVGHRISKYSFITRAVTDHGVEGFGFGEGETELLTFQKSISESIERAVYLSLKPYLRSTSSNGWATHLSEEKAKTAALNELLERDAALTHWLTETPFLELDRDDFPLWLNEWSKRVLSQSKDFNTIRILISTHGYIPIVQAVLLNEEGHAFTSQAASSGFDQAIYRALSEVFRIASSAKHDRTLVNIDSEEAAVTPWDHALAYETKKFPTWIFGRTIPLREAKKIFRNHKKKGLLARTSPTFTTFACGDLFISNCRSKKTQDLFFGRNDFALKRGQINLERLKEVSPKLASLNPLLHCVP